MIAYINANWRAAEHGGALMLLDERPGDPSWRAVEPLAGRIAIFLSESVLHKVEPTYRTRYALTKFWFGVHTKQAES